MFCFIVRYISILHSSSTKTTLEKSGSSTLNSVVFQPHSCKEYITKPNYNNAMNLGLFIIHIKYKLEL